MSTSETYHHGDLRNALLDGAERMVDADPARSISLRELARTVGVSHAAPYKHFAGLAQLRDALAARWLGQLVDAQQVASTGSARDALLAAGRAYVDWATAHPARYAAVYDRSVDRGPGGDEAVAVETARHSALLRRLVDEARAAGVLPASADAEAARLWATVHGLASLATLGYLAPSAIEQALEASVPGSRKGMVPDA